MNDIWMRMPNRRKQTMDEKQICTKIPSKEANHYQSYTSFYLILDIFIFTGIIKYKTHW